MSFSCSDLLANWKQTIQQ